MIDNASGGIRQRVRPPSSFPTGQSCRRGVHSVLAHFRFELEGPLDICFGGGGTKSLDNKKGLTVAETKGA